MVFFSCSWFVQLQLEKLNYPQHVTLGNSQSNLAYTARSQRANACAKASSSNLEQESDEKGFCADHLCYLLLVIVDL